MLPSAPRRRGARGASMERTLSPGQVQQLRARVAESEAEVEV